MIDRIDETKSDENKSHERNELEESIKPQAVRTKRNIVGSSVGNACDVVLSEVETHIDVVPAGVRTRVLMLKGLENWKDKEDSDEENEDDIIDILLEVELGLIIEGEVSPWHSL